MNQAMFIDAVGMLDADLIEAYVHKDNALRTSRKRRGNKRYLVTILAAAVAMLLSVTLLLTSLPLYYAVNSEKLGAAFDKATDAVLFPLDGEDSEDKQKDVLINWLAWPITEQMFKALGAGTDDSVIEQMQSAQSGLAGDMWSKLGEFLERMYQYYIKHTESQEMPETPPTEQETEETQKSTVELDGCTYRRPVGAEYWSLLRVNELEDGVLKIPKEINGMPVQRISPEAAKDNLDLLEVIMPDTIREIGNNAFSGCGNLSAIEWSDSLQCIDAYAFAYCSSLKSVILPATLEKMGNYAFAWCAVDNEKGLEHVALSESLVTIPYYCFTGNTFLTTVEIPDSAVNIQDQAFYMCRALENITLPSSIRSIGEKSFMGTGLTALHIPEGVTSLQSSAFMGCDSLTRIELPSTLQEIGTYVFKGCSSLQNISLPEGLISIGAYAFANTGLTGLTVPSSMHIVSDYAFYECKSLESVTLQAGVSDVMDHAFASCTSLHTVQMYEGLTAIGSFAFEGCAALAKVDLPEGLISVGEKAFAETAIKQVDLPTTIRSFGHQAFVTVEHVTMDISAAMWYSDRIHRDMSAAVFADGTKIKLLDAEDLANFSSDLEYTQITGTGSAYDGCYELTSLGIYDFIDEIDVSAYYDSTKVIGLKRAFYQNAAIQSVLIPDTVQYISPEEFLQCTKLQYVRLSESISELPQACFMGCTALETITIPVSVQSINNQAFASCTALKSIVYNGSIQQWKQIDVEDGAIAPGTVIVCTDGEIIMK